MRALGADPGRGVALIRARLGPAPAADAAKVRRLLAALDDDDFQVRQRATRELTALGDAAEGLIDDFVAANPPVEARRRVLDILALRQPERLRQQRALEVLERLATPAACDVLRRLARGDAGAGLTRDARAALRRIEARK
jgi:hypothetical protein